MSKITPKKEKVFTITARVVIIKDLDIKADTFEKALEEAQKLSESDFVSYEGSPLYSSIRIVSISSPDAWQVERPRG
jgi:hypothetical protein